MSGMLRWLPASKHWAVFVVVVVLFVVVAAAALLLLLVVVVVGWLVGWFIQLKSAIY